MKKVTLLSILLGCMFLSIAQPPQSFNYQAVVRDNSGELIQDQDVSFRISILDGSATGAGVYQEKHIAHTNDFGLVSLKVGTGTVLSGVFSDIDWANADKYIKVEVDPSGGTAYATLGTSQIHSTPYALHAGNAHWKRNGANVYYNGGKVGIGTDAPGDAILETRGNINMNCYAGGGAFLRFIENDQKKWSWLYKSWATSTFTLHDEEWNKAVMAFKPETGHIGINTIFPEVPLHIQGGSDLGTSLGGYVILGPSNGYNLVMDEDEIAARNNGATSSLKLNWNGGFVGIGCEGQNLLDVLGSGSTHGGVPGYGEVVGHFKNSGAGHSAISLDANNDQDAILYFAENGTPRWSIRTDVSDDISSSVKNNLEFRDHMDGYNQVAWEITRYATKYAAWMHGDILPAVGGSYFLGSSAKYWEYIYADQFINVSKDGLLNSSEKVQAPLGKILLLNPLKVKQNKETGYVTAYALDPKEVKPIVPEAVHEPEDPGDAWGMKYNQLIPLLISAIQEQQEQIEALKSEVAAMKK